MQFSHLGVNCVLITSTPRNGKTLNHRHNFQHLRPSSLEFPLVSSKAIGSFGSLLMVQYIEVQCRYGYKGPYILKQPQEFQIAYYTTAVFSRAVFQVASRVTTENSVKTVPFPTRLKLSESANFNRILIKFKPPNQVA